MEGRARDRVTWHVVAPVLGSIAGLVALRLLGRDIVSQEQIQAWLQPLGKLAPLAFILFLAVRPITLLPGQFFTAVGGLMFGALSATIYSLVGSFLASVLIFLLARRLGSPLMKKAMGGRYPALVKAARHHDFRFSLLVCINPLFPTDVAQAAAAASGARFWSVALGTLLGTVPGTYVTAAFGSAIGQGRTVMTAIAAAGMVVSLFLGVLLGKRVVTEVQRAESEPQGQRFPPPPPPVAASSAAPSQP